MYENQFCQKNKVVVRLFCKINIIDIKETSRMKLTKLFLIGINKIIYF